MPQIMPATRRPDARNTQGRDPLSSYVARIAAHPVPLVATHCNIAIEGGFAIVTAERRFKNAEAGSIEATLTFPLPVHAVLHHLEARIGDRKLIAVPQPRKDARETYETALEQGKTTVLHEELLRGVHMLSVGHIAPGTEIAVAMRWSMLATFADGQTQLRIPLTVGDVYGRSGLADSDELTHAPSALRGTLSIACAAPRFRLNGREQPGPVSNLPIALDAPIDIAFDRLRPAVLSGRMADGRPVSLRIDAAPQFDTPIDAAVLIDRSGSMSSPVSGDGAKADKHASVLLGLSEAAVAMRDGDVLALCEFSEQCRPVGKASTAKELRALIRQLSAPGGGTEIGQALAQAIASGARDVILITDGKSHALDVQELARSGCRFTVVLIGEDSLEANAGHLAALTGGSIFAALGADTAASVTAAIASVRAGPGGRRVKSEAAPSEIVLTRSGLRIGAAWSKVPANATCTDEEHAVAALAASLLLPDLDEAAALELALAEGLVGHLTSLVLVDEDGPATGDHAANRKIALPSPRTAAAAGGMMTAHMRAGPQVMYALAGAPAPAPAPKAAAGSAVPLPPPPARDLATLAHDIDWQMRPQRLIAGDVSVLPPEVAAAVVAAAKTTALETAARRLGIVAAALVIGLMARALAGNDRLAGRIARAILKTADAKLLDELAQRLGLLSATMRTAAGR